MSSNTNKEIKKQTIDFLKGREYERLYQLGIEKNNASRIIIKWFSGLSLEKNQMIADDVSKLLSILSPQPEENNTDTEELLLGGSTTVGSKDVKITVKPEEEKDCDCEAETFCVHCSLCGKRLACDCKNAPQPEKQCNCQYEQGHGLTCPLYVPSPNPLKEKTYIQKSVMYRQEEVYNQGVADGKREVLDNLPLYRAGGLQTGETEQYRKGRNEVLKEIRDTLSNQVGNNK